MIRDIVRKKRDGQELTQEEINAFIKGLVNNEYPDYLVSALLMAIYINGMTEQETLALTLAMARSGKVCDLSGVRGVKVDKHSTGGVGDTVTLVLAPMLAACGVTVAKMSGRGLGHTGGTVDKLESIPGMNMNLSMEEFINLANENGLCITGQSADLAPADKILYALRDVTETVSSIPLIASSVMSKKLAAGADCILLDVKAGSGAFMRTPKDARALAELMVRIGKGAGKQVQAVITDMNRPLGAMIGNRLEIIEAVKALKGKMQGSPLMEVCLEIGSRLLLMAKAVNTLQEGRQALVRSIENGSAFAKFEEFIKAQGGDVTVLQREDLREYNEKIIAFTADQSGYITQMQAELLGIAALELGAGRHTKADTIDFGAGIELKAHLGDYINCGQELAVLYTKKDDAAIAKALDLLKRAIKIDENKTEIPPLIYGVVE